MSSRFGVSSMHLCLRVLLFFSAYTMRILIGVTGSVAAIKVRELIDALREEKKSDVEIRVILTNSAVQFISDFSTLSAQHVYTDESEWKSWTQKGDPVLHIELRKWCDVFLICPLSANTLAKICHGICDNLLTSVVRAWDSNKRLVLCPAMNSLMWKNPLTARQLKDVKEIYKCEIIEPKSEYLLACGDVGPGALASVQDIVEYIN